MPADETPILPSEFNEIFNRLSDCAKVLNEASDGLGATVRTVDQALARLNLGIESWVRAGGWEDAQGPFELRYLGYARVQRQWGVAVSSRRGHEEFPERGTEETWLFNDAPRAYRIEAIEKLPQLLHKLAEDAVAATDDIVRKNDVARELVTALRRPMVPPAPPPPKPPMPRPRVAQQPLPAGVPASPRKTDGVK
jgi:hypothetical protein